MDDERASAEEMGERAIDRIRQIYDKTLAKAHDVESFNEAFSQFAGEIETAFREQLVHWVSLPVEQKDHYVKGMAKVAVGPYVPDLLSELEKKFASGERTALFAAIKLCAEFGALLPGWAATAFLEGYAKVEKLELDSWDTAFGRPKVVSQRLPEARKRRQLIGTIVARVDVLREQKPGQSLDWIYGEIASELRVNVKIVRELYNRERRQRPRDGLERWRHVIPSGGRPRRKL